MISNREKLKILKQYLGIYNIPFSERERNIVVNSIPFGKECCYILGKEVDLKKMGCCILLLNGRREFSSIFTYELIDRYLGDVEENEVSFYSITSQLLFLYHLKNTMMNKQLENMICHLLSYRKMIGLSTVLLTEIPLGKVEIQVEGLVKLKVENLVSQRKIEEI